MEDERIVPALVSVYKAEVWRHLGFCGNVCPGTAARAPPRFRHLPRPVWKAFARRAAGSVRGCSFLSCRGRFVQLGRCSRRGLGDFTQNINTNWKTCEIQVERFWECSTSVFILLLYICFVFIRNPASTLFFINTKQMYFFVEIKMLWHCILQL